MSSETSRYPRRGFLGRLAALGTAAAAVTSWRPNWSFAKSVPIPDELLRLPVMPEAELAERVESLLRFIDPQLLHRYKPIAPDENAWPFWERALEAYVPEPSDDAYEEAVGQWEYEGTPLPPIYLKRVRDWVVANQAASALIDEGLARGKLETPRASKSCRLAMEMDDALALRKLADVRGTASRLALMDGDIERALSEATAAMRMGLLMLRSEGLVIDYLMAHAALGIGETQIYRTAMSKKSSTAHAKRAIEILNEANDDAERLSDTLRVEFCRWFIPTVAAAPRTNDAEELAKYLVLKESVDRTAEMSRDARKEYARAVRDATFVFSGHPRLFDPEATAQLASQLYLEHFVEKEKPLDARNYQLVAELGRDLEAWSIYIDANPALVTGWQGSESGWPAPSEGMLIAARTELRQVDNLFGKLLVEEQWSSPVCVVAENVKLRANAAKLLIALHHFERQHGRLPEELAELLPDGWLLELPVDPYAQRPLRYSAQDRLIWPVGRDGAKDIPDSVRNADYDPEWEHWRMIWTVPS